MFGKPIHNLGTGKNYQALIIHYSRWNGAFLHL